jgi:hypothetical protein
MEEDVILLTAVAAGFASCVVAMRRLFRWFIEPERWRLPTYGEPS